VGGGGGKVLFPPSAPPRVAPRAKRGAHPPPPPSPTLDRGILTRADSPRLFSRHSPFHGGGMLSVGGEGLVPPRRPDSRRPLARGYPG